MATLTLSLLSLPPPSPSLKNPRISLRARAFKSPIRSNLTDSAFKFDAVSDLELERKGFMGLRKTKLVCTVGPACCGDTELERMAMGGMNVVRLNMCHNSREWHRDVIGRVRRLNEEKGFCVSVMVDTEGSQMHVIDQGSDSSVKAEDGSKWLFTIEKFKGSHPFTVQVNFEGFSEGIMVGDELVIDGGMATFEVVEKVGSDLHCRCTDPGLLLPRAKLSFWRNGELVGKDSGLPTLSSKDWADIEFAISEGVDFIAVSFIKDANDIKHLKSYLSRRSADFIKVLAKIESLESIENLEDIIEASDGVMVARGDLGVHIPLEQIPEIQEEITRICRQLNKPVIVASQLLESMIEYPTPTRAEVADVSEAVRQYADALMLSGESAVGSFADKALSVLCMASGRMELSSREENHQRNLVHRQLAVSLPDRISEQICNSAVEMANSLAVDAIFVFTKHGYMASLLSRNRPNPPIFAFTDHPGARKSMNLLWGVIPIELPFSENMEANVRKTLSLMKCGGSVKSGDVILVVSELSFSSGAPSVFQSIQVKLSRCGSSQSRFITIQNRRSVYHAWWGPRARGAASVLWGYEPSLIENLLKNHRSLKALTPVIFKSFFMLKSLSLSGKYILMMVTDLRFESVAIRNIRQKI